MKIPVTGGACFIGSNVVDAYIAAGHEVLVVDSLSSGKLENIDPKAKFYKIDIRTGDIKRSCLDAKMAEKILGWMPEVDLKTGIELTVKWRLAVNSKKAAKGEV